MEMGEVQKEAVVYSFHYRQVFSFVIEQESLVLSPSFLSLFCFSNLCLSKTCSAFYYLQKHNMIKIFQIKSLTKTSLTRTSKVSIPILALQKVIVINLTF